MVYRVFVEKKEGLQNEAKALLSEINELLSIKSLTDVRVINRYDAENITEELFNYAVGLDIATPEIEIEKGMHTTVFGVEFLPGQFDQRADSAAQCIQIISQGDRPTIRSAKVYVLYGELTDAEIAEIKKYVINPVEAREAALAKPATLAVQYEIPTTVKTLDGFNQLDREGLARFIADYGLAMDIDDIAFCQQYFQSEHRDPTITEIRMIDTYWSDQPRRSRASRRRHKRVPRADRGSRRRYRSPRRRRARSRWDGYGSRS